MECKLTNAMRTHHWTRMLGCTIGSNVLSCIRIFYKICKAYITYTLHWFGLVLTATRLLLAGGHVNSSFTTFEAPIHLTKQAHQMGVQCMGVKWSLDDIIWSSNCHLIADLRSLLGSVWYHGWIVPQSSDHDAVACVSVVTLLALLLTLGTFGNHTSSPPQTQHKSSTLLF